jgi:hypothetical protein
MTSIKDVEGGNESSRIGPRSLGARPDQSRGVHPVRLQYREADNEAGLAVFRGVFRAWKVLYAAQRERRLATTGPYARIRHPQYAGFILILLGILLQWPTLLRFPALVYMYYRLALREERDSREAFGEAWDEFAARTRRVPLPAIPETGILLRIALPFLLLFTAASATEQPARDSIPRGADAPGYSSGSRPSIPPEENGVWPGKARNETVKIKNPSEEAP